MKIDIEMLAIEISDTQEANSPAVVVPLSPIALTKRIPSPVGGHARAFGLSSAAPINDSTIFRID